MMDTAAAMRRRRTVRGASRRGGAFTLVELVVVVGLLAVLVAALVPSLGRARSAGRSALCRHNLQQIWEVFHDSVRSDPMAFPRASFWTSFVAERAGGGVLRCPEDDRPVSAGGGLDEVYIDHFHCDGIHYHAYLTDCLAPDAPLGVKPFHQMTVTHVSGLVKEVRIYGGASIRITLGEPVVVEALDDNPETIGGSDHHLCRGGEVLMEMMGMTNTVASRPQRVVLGGGRVSYGMNSGVAAIAGRPQQILLLDYDRSVADVAMMQGGYDDLAPRHFGRANVVFVDGSVQARWPSDLLPDNPAWQP